MTSTPDQARAYAQAEMEKWVAAAQKAGSGRNRRPPASALQQRRDLTAGVLDRRLGRLGAQHGGLHLRDQDRLGAVGLGEGGNGGRAVASAAASIAATGFSPAKLGSE